MTTPFYPPTISIKLLRIHDGQIRICAYLDSRDRAYTTTCRSSANIFWSMSQVKGVNRMYGTFGGYTRWAVVFLIIFVLFFLLVPAYGAGAAY